MKDKDKRISGIATVIVLAMCSTWSLVATGLSLQMYLPGLTSKADDSLLIDLMFEIDCAASSFNVALPVAVAATVVGVIFARKHKLLIFSTCVAAGLFFITLSPG